MRNCKAGLKSTGRKLNLEEELEAGNQNNVASKTETPGQSKEKRVFGLY